jgi:hypothetical protein
MSKRLLKIENCFLMGNFSGMNNVGTKNNAGGSQGEPPAETCSLGVKGGGLRGWFRENFDTRIKTWLSKILPWYILFVTKLYGWPPAIPHMSRGKRSCCLQQGEL